jgi:tRNA pseudouridine38-40 synthase
MPTYRLDVAYDGSRFSGYATQPRQRTIQGELETALGRLVETPFLTAVAGRTDAGVHARGQVVSLVVDEQLETERVARSLNGLVGPEIAVMAMADASDDFNARFSATWRRYRYLIDLGTAPDPLTRHMAWHVRRPLDVAAMRRVGEGLVGEHDFTSFCRSVEGRSNVRRVDGIEWKSNGEFLELWIEANAFCHQMVRSIVGYSYDVGRGFSPPDQVAETLAAKDRSVVATVAPPHGLTLWEVGFDRVSSQRM